MEKAELSRLWILTTLHYSLLSQVLYSLDSVRVIYGACMFIAVQDSVQEIRHVMIHGQPASATVHNDRMIIVRKTR